MPVAASTVPTEMPRDPQRIYSIAELAREFAITARTIRFYEDEGLIKPRRQGLTRLYSAGDRTRLGWILRGKRLGFSLAEIKELLDLYQVDRTGVQQLRELLRRSRLHIEDLERGKRDLARYRGIQGRGNPGRCRAEEARRRNRERLSNARFTPSPHAEERAQRASRSIGQRRGARAHPSRRGASHRSSG